MCLFRGGREVPAQTRHPRPRKWEVPAPAGGMSASEGLHRDLPHDGAINHGTPSP